MDVTIDETGHDDLVLDVDLEEIDAAAETGQHRRRDGEADRVGVGYFGLQRNVATGDLATLTGYALRNLSVPIGRDARMLALLQGSRRRSTGARVRAQKPLLPIRRRRKQLDQSRRANGALERAAQTNIVQWRVLDFELVRIRATGGRVL